ncbi:MAG: Tail Collar domain protein [Bacteroidetes bacterium]|nr:Tail Collar domain protein [Bacteroidota bacterium]
MRKKIFTLMIAITCAASGLLAQDAFIGEIRIFAINFAPRGWMPCEGQLLPISQNTALFALLGTTYGGNGRTNFALPNLQGRVALNPGEGPGLTPLYLGEEGGSPSVTLLQSEMPVHYHPLFFTDAQATTNVPQADVMPAFNASLNFPGITKPVNTYAVPVPGTIIPFAPQTLSLAGGSQPHNNMQPYLVLNYFIAVQGIFPPRQ